MWTAFELIVDLLQALMMLWFMKNRLHIPKRRILPDIICVLAIAGFFALYEFIDMPVSDVLVFLIPLIYALAVAEDKWSVSLFWTLALGILFMAAISLSLHIFMAIPGVSYDELVGKTGGRLLFVFCGNAVIFLLLRAATRIKKEITSPEWPTMILFVLLNSVLIVVEESVFSLQMKLYPNNDEVGGVLYFLAYIGVLFCIFLSVYLFHMMSQSVARENRYKLEADTMALSKKHMLEMEDMYVDLQAQKHDFKQHFQALDEMVRSGAAAEARSYLATYKKTLFGNEAYRMGCTAADALLAAKRLTMQKENIAFEYRANPLSDLPINEADFCAIVGNVLDNAIEGTVQAKKTNEVQPVRLTFSRSWDMFYIFSMNSCDPNALQKDKNGWKSSKKQDGQHNAHAIGIRNIQKIVDEAEGRCSFYAKDDVFYVKIVIPFPFERNVEKC